MEIFGRYPLQRRQTLKAFVFFKDLAGDSLHVFCVFMPTEPKV